jgi:hypothetical protein
MTSAEDWERGRESFAAVVNVGGDLVATKAPRPPRIPRLNYFQESGIEGLDVANWTCVSLLEVSNCIWSIGEEKCHDLATTSGVFYATETILVSQSDRRPRREIPGRPPQPRRGVVQKSSRPMLQEVAEQEVAPANRATFAPPFFFAARNGKRNLPATSSPARCARAPFPASAAGLARFCGGLGLPSARGQSGAGPHSPRGRRR